MNTSLFVEYENILLGNATGFSLQTIKRVTTDGALELYRYAFSTLLGWSPVKIKAQISPKLIEFMKLGVFLKKIPCPVELDPEKDFFYVAEAMYPSLTSEPHLKELRIQHVYEKVIEGKLKKFPKKFFAMYDAKQKACICLRMAIKEGLDAKNADALYKIFADQKYVSDFLKKSRLHTVCNDLYETPIDFLHDALMGEHKNATLFHFYKWASYYRKVKGFRTGRLVKAGDVRVEYEKFAFPVECVVSDSDAFIEGELGRSFRAFVKACLNIQYEEGEEILFVKRSSSANDERISP